MHRLSDLWYELYFLVTLTGASFSSIFVSRVSAPLLPLSRLAFLSSSPMLLLAGSIDGRPVSVLIGPAAMQSLISTSFVFSHSLPRTLFPDGTIMALLCPVVLPTPQDWYMLRVNLLVVYLSPHDIVLGQDVATRVGHLGAES